MNRLNFNRPDGSDHEEFIRWLAERHDALCSMDTGWFANYMDRLPDHPIVLVAMHKMRYEILSMPDNLRRESRAWLVKQGYSRMGGVPWPPADKLETHLE